ncbi:MAG: zinc-binding dehydrogenase, partial [Limisphaerales bacterium]
LLGPAMPTLQEQLAPFLAGESVTVAMDYSGVPDSMEMLLDVLGIGGALVLVGATYPQRPITLSAEQVVRRLHTIKGLHNYNQSDLVAGVEFIEKHFRKFPFEQLVDDRFSLEQVDEAFKYALTSRAYRVGIRI